MKVIVASENPVKVRAVGRALDQRPDLPYQRRSIVPLASVSSVPEQPSGPETAQGAVNRVNHLREQHAADMYVGIESGLFLMRPGGPVMDFCVVYLWTPNGESFGTSSGFMLPLKVQTQFLDETGAFRPDLGSYTLDHALKDLGLTENPRLGYDIGLVGLLSEGRITREDYTFEAVRNALLGLPSSNRKQGGT